MDPHAILLVDDDYAVRTLFERALRRFGFEVVGVENAGRALCAARRRQFAVVAVDYALPEIDGVELIERLRELQPEATYVLVSGFYSEAFRDERQTLTGADFLLGKPCSIHRLADIVREAVDGFELRHTATA
jgi:DNA-binding NtrC family response regulator